MWDLVGNPEDQFSQAEVQFILTGKQPIPVGWARIPMFQRQSTHGATSVTSLDINWDMLAGDQTFDLHPGDIPDTMISMLPVTPTQEPDPNESKLTVKFLNFRTPKNFAVMYQKFKPRGQTLGYFVKMMQME